MEQNFSDNLERSCHFYNKKSRYPVKGYRDGKPKRKLSINYATGSCLDRHVRGSNL